MKTKTEDYLEIFNQLDFTRIKDHPNILIAANFWDKERCTAAKICYKLLREIDDYIDNYKSGHPVITANEKERMVNHVNKWVTRLQKGSAEESVESELAEVFHTFQIPLWPMELFARSMIYDIYNDGFPSVQAFLDYAQGASIAPASIFVHLCGIKKIDGHFIKPIFDIREAATPCATFSYLVHIIRDFQIDQESNLNYFADNLIQKYGLTRQDLLDMAHGGKIQSGFRQLIREYMQVMDLYRQQTFAMIEKISPYLEPKYQLSLHIIFTLYLMIYERIDPEKGSFSTSELNPTAEEIKERVYQTICKFQEN